MISKIVNWAFGGGAEKSATEGQVSAEPKPITEDYVSSNEDFMSSSDGFLTPIAPSPPPTAPKPVNYEKLIRVERQIY